MFLTMCCAGKSRSSVETRSRSKRALVSVNQAAPMNEPGAKGKVTQQASVRGIMTRRILFFSRVRVLRSFRVCCWLRSRRSNGLGACGLVFEVVETGMRLRMRVPRRQVQVHAECVAVGTCMTKHKCWRFGDVCAASLLHVFQALSGTSVGTRPLGGLSWVKNNTQMSFLKFYETSRRTRPRNAVHHQTPLSVGKLHSAHSLYG
jgi:hypothetical protein